MEDALLQNPNYVSVEDHMDYVEKFFREEQDEGLMVELEESVVRERWGDRVAIASTAAIQERDKTRIIHDGTHGVQVNHRMKMADFLRNAGGGREEGNLT